MYKWLLDILLLDEMMSDFAKNFDPASEYKAYQDEASAEWTLANAALHYINYFEEEIESLGLAADFKSLQDVAYKATRKQDVPTVEQDLLNEFEAKVFEVYETYSNNLN